MTERALPEFALCPAHSINTKATCRQITIALELPAKGVVLCGCAQHATRWLCRSFPNQDERNGCKTIIKSSQDGASSLPQNYSKLVDGFPATKADFLAAMGIRQQPQSLAPRGSLAKKQSEYEATAVIPHLNTPQNLELCVGLLEAQTIKPYIVVIDTGSDDESAARVLKLRSDNVEVHQISQRGLDDEIDAVCAAMDLGMSLCSTEYLWCLHSDCFVVNPNMLAELLQRARGGQRPVIGYQSVPREGSLDWQGMVSHTCTLLHMPTMHQIDASWSKRRLAARANQEGRSVILDTEMMLNYRLRERGIKPYIIGAESRCGIERDLNRIHLRSANLSQRLKAAGCNVGNESDTVLDEVRKTLASLSKQSGTTRRNLIYHVAPFSRGGVWRKNVRQLLRRIDLFNGKRIVAIATGQDMDPPYEVKREFGNNAIEFIEIPNSRALRERATFIPLMESIESREPNEVTFYAHAKGVATIGDQTSVMWWRNAMYHVLLDDWKRVEDALRTASVVGCFREKTQGIFPDGKHPVDWHFAGTYFWFKNRALFSKPDWRELPSSGWAVEAYPGLKFKYDESACLYADDVHCHYTPDAHSLRIDDEEPCTEVTGAIKLELGGGRFPLGKGFLNVDNLDIPGVDVTFNFDDLPGKKLPFNDASVQHIYSSHCIEHVKDYKPLLHEIVRVGCVGCLVEIKVPYWLHSMAMCYDHKHTIAEAQVDHWCNSAIDFWFGGQPRRLQLSNTHYQPGPSFAEGKALNPTWTDEQVMKYFPNACHEVHYVMYVVDNK